MFEDSGLQRVVLPSTLRVIHVGAFSHCEALKQITFPDGLKKIEERAFAKTGLTKVAIPKIARVASDAFDLTVKKE